MNVPAGFSELVALVKAEGSPKKKAFSTEDMWKQMAWVLFLGQKRSEAAINYIYDILDDAELLDFAQLSKYDADDWAEWEDRVRAVIQKFMEKEEDEKQEVPRSLLAEMRGRNDRENPLFYIRSAMRYFREEKLDWNVIEKRTASGEKTREFLKEMYMSYGKEPNYKKITGLGQTKAVTWLHMLGKADDVVALTGHVRNFINFDVFGRAYNEAERDESALEDEFAAVVEAVGKKAKGASAKDIQTAVWVWKACQGLLAMAGRGIKGNLTAEKMTAFLKKKKLNYVRKHLSDMDRQLKLAEELLDFLGK